LPRKTDSAQPGDWLYLAQGELDAVTLCAQHGVGYAMCRSKLAEVLEKLLKAELIRTGWFLQKTHDLRKLGQELELRASDLMPQVRPLCVAQAQVYFSDRYPGFDLEDPDWPKLREQLAEVTALAEAIKARLPQDG
jgi:HEPN domain-containing protein